MTALNGIAFAVPGITWRSTAQMHIADIVPGASWAACTGARLEANKMLKNNVDGAARVLEVRAGAYEHACLTRLVVATNANWGASRGWGQLSTRAAEGFTQIAAETLGVADANTVFVPTGSVLTHFPVGEALVALTRAKSAQRCATPGTATGKEAKFVGLRAISAEGPIAVGAGCFLVGEALLRDGFGEVWLAATDFSVSRGVLDVLLERLWLAGPVALRLARGGAHPADALIVIASGHGNENAEITDIEDPRLEPIASTLAVALTMVAQLRAKEENLSEVVLEGAESAREAVAVAGKLAPLLAGVRRDLREQQRKDKKIDEKHQFSIATALRAGLVAAAVPGLEYSLIRACIEDCVLLNNAMPIPRSSNVATEEKKATVLQKWLLGEIPLKVTLARGHSDTRFFV